MWKLILILVFVFLVIVFVATAFAISRQLLPASENATVFSYPIVTYLQGFGLGADALIIIFAILGLILLYSRIR
jgi:hypothetical protein